MPKLPFIFNVKFTNTSPLDPEWSWVAYEVEASTAAEAEVKARGQWEEDRPGEARKQHTVAITPLK